MATRRKKKTWDVALWELLVGKPSKGKRSSSGRRKSGAHPLNLKRRYNRWAATVDTNRAASLKERNDLAAKRSAALLARDKEKARAKAAKEKKRLEADKAKKARIHAAQARRMQQTQPTVRTVPAQPVVTQRRATPTEVGASLCNSTETDDGRPCQNKTNSGPCSAAHKPKGKPNAMPRKPARPARTHDGLGRPLDEKGKRFFDLRDSGYKGPIDQDGYATEGNRGRRPQSTGSRTG